MKFFQWRTLTTLAVGLMFVTTAGAVPVLLNPVAVPFNGVADTGALPAVTTVIAPTVLPNNLGSPVSPMDGTVTEAVYRDNSTGFLDFVYQLNLTAESSGSGVKMITLNGYFYGQAPLAFDSAAYFDAGTEPTGFSDATAPNPIPDTANQTLNFNQIHFNWKDLSPPLVSGQQVGLGTTLVVFTQATSIKSADILVQDEGQLDVQGYAPAPEPAWAGVMLGCLFGAGLVVARRFQTKQS